MTPSTMKVYLLLFITWRSRAQEEVTPSSQLMPRNFNQHSFQDFELAEPTKQGPVLFPNDSPPPPRPPLIVTSRPLVESIARSELAGNHLNNTETSQSQSRVSFLPFLARVKDYRPYIPSPTFDYQFVPTRVPYAAVTKASHNHLERDNRYDDYEEQTVLPPIYKALSEHANWNVLKIQQQKQSHYQAQLPTYPRQYQNNDINEEDNSEYDQTQPPTYPRQYQNNDINEETNSEYDQNQNYAFSYTVKDHKTGDDFSHSQHSSGSATNGEYRVRLPDGRMQIVSYTADENGYKADVRYDEDKSSGNTIEDGYNQHNDYVRHNQHNDYVRHNQHNDYVQHNNYEAHNKHNEYEPSKYKYVTPTQSYVAPILNNYVTPNQHNNYINQQTDYSDRHVDYTDRSNKQDYVDAITDKKALKSTNEKGEKDYYQYPDISKEYYNDYSSEYNSNYEPHRSKFNFGDDKKDDITNKATASTVKPSYEEIKNLFVTKSLYNTQQNYDPVEINVPSTTPISYDGTTERVVHIGVKNPNLYTNIKHSLLNLNVTPVPVSYATPKLAVATTPRSYLVSTINNLKNKVSLVTKPVLSDDFISRINKYINFN